MKIAIGNDHHGVTLKKELVDDLKKQGYEVINYGSDSEEMVDYTKYAFLVGEAVRDHKVDFGILICGSGIGMSIACNKVKGVRCAKVNDKEEAFLARSHNNANVIDLSEKTTDYKEIIDTFLTTDFSNEEKHHRRVEMIDNYDN